MNAAGPLVSICVPTYNGGEFLRDCLASIQAQTLGDFEVLIVDDDSQDDSYEIAAGFASRDPRFLVHRNPNRLGLVGNWNRCLELSRGTWIKLVFQDDLIESHCLERLVESCGRHKRTFAFCDRNFLFDDSVDDATRDAFRRHQAMITEAYEKEDYADAGQFARICAQRPGVKCDRRADRCAFSPVGHPKLWPVQSRSRPAMRHGVLGQGGFQCWRCSRPGKTGDLFAFMAVQPPRTIKPIARIARRSSIRDF